MHSWRRLPSGDLTRDWSLLTYIGILTTELSDSRKDRLLIRTQIRIYHARVLVSAVVKPTQHCRESARPVDALRLRSCLHGIQDFRRRASKGIHGEMEQQGFHAIGVYATLRRAARYSPTPRCCNSANQTCTTVNNEADYLPLLASCLILGAVEPQPAIIMHNSPGRLQPGEAETGGCIEVDARRDISGTN